MTAVAPRRETYVAPARPEPTGNARKGSKFWMLLTTTDHKPVSYTHLTLPTILLV